MKKIKGLLYCTKAKKQKDLLWSNNLKHFFLDGAYNRLIDNLPKYLLNGTIPCECEIEVEEITPSTWNAETERRILKESCLKEHQLFDYIINGDENESQNPFYAIHIKNLHIFDKPYKLGESFIYNRESQRIVEKAPQNMMRVWLYENGDLVMYILISIQPQWLCKILNGEKTIEVRKQILNCMKRNEYYE